MSTWMRAIVAAMAVGLTMPGAATAAEDCALGARYFELAEQAGRELRSRDRYEFLERAVAVCNRFAYWQALGEAAAGMGDEALNQRAAEAFVEAHELATDEASRARVIADYAELLFNANQRQQALTYIYRARNLDPANEDIARRAQRFAEAAERITEDDVVRGLSDMRLKPLKLREEVAAAPTGGGSGSINIPIHFEFGSTELVPASQRNVAVLAQTLAERFPDGRIVLVGHADVRGGASQNMALSIARANTIHDLVVEQEPTLRGRVDVEGRGESEPLSLGTTERDHQVNRRLEVRVR